MQLSHHQLQGLAIVSHYFKRRRTLAIGLVTGGSSLGMQRKILFFIILKVVCAGAITHSIMLNRFFNGPVGFHNGVRISAALNVCLLLIANITCKTRLPPRKTENRLRLKDFICDPPYVLLIIGSVFSPLVSRSRTLTNIKQDIPDVLWFIFPFLLPSA